MDKLYYISQGETPQEHLSNIKHVCEAGIQLVQLRLKEVSDEVYLETALKAKEICEATQATLIINDHISVAQKAKAHGIHLGKQDQSILEAKKQLNSSQLIGGTANTLEDCIQLIEQGVDYIGLGPFRYTTTKKNLSPILGKEGYTSIYNSLLAKGYNTPIYAIGGITQDDFETLFEIGIHGIAVSSLFSNTSIKELKKIIDASTTNSR